MQRRKMLTFIPFVVNVFILYPLKAPTNLWFSGVFRVYKTGILARNGLTINLHETITLPFWRITLSKKLQDEPCW